MTKRKKGSAKYRKPLENKRGRGDSNPQPPDRQSDEPDLQPVDWEAVAATLSTVCTRVCTSEPKMGHAELLKSLAGVFRKSLSDDDCQTLADLLSCGPNEENA